MNVGKARTKSRNKPVGSAHKVGAGFHIAEVETVEGKLIKFLPATFAVFLAIFSAIAVIGLLEGFKYKDGIERKGVLGLTTTLGDRLFITLLGSAYIFLAWLGIVGQPIWIPLFIAIGWGVFVFWKV